MAVRKKLGEILIEQGAASAELVKRGLGHQRQWGGKIGRILVEMGSISEEQLARALAAQSRMPLAKMKSDVPASVTALIPPDLSQKHQAVAFGMRTVDKVETVYVAIADPYNVPGMDELRFRIGKAVKFALAPADDIARAVARAQGDEFAIPADVPAIQFSAAAAAANPTPAQPQAPVARGEPLAALSPAVPQASGDPLSDLFGAPEPKASASSELDDLLGLSAPPAPPPQRPSASSALDDLFDANPSPSRRAPASTPLQSARPAAEAVAPLPPMQAPQPSAVEALLDVAAKAPEAVPGEFSLDVGSPAEALASLAPVEPQPDVGLEIPEEAPLQLESGAEAAAILSSQYTPGEVPSEEQPAELELSEADALPGIELTAEEAEPAVEIDALQIGAIEENPTLDVENVLAEPAASDDVSASDGAEEFPDIPSVELEVLEGEELPPEGAEIEPSLGFAEIPAAPDAGGLEQDVGEPASLDIGMEAGPAENEYEASAVSAPLAMSGGFDFDGSVAGEDLDLGAESLFEAEGAGELVAGDGEESVPGLSAMPEATASVEPEAAPTWDLDASAMDAGVSVGASGSHETVEELSFEVDAAPSLDVDVLHADDSAADLAPVETAQVISEQAPADLGADESAPSWTLDGELSLDQAADDASAGPVLPVAEAVDAESPFELPLDESAIAPGEQSAEMMVEVSDTLPVEVAPESAGADDVEPSWDLDGGAMAEEPPETDFSAEAWQPEAQVLDASGPLDQAVAEPVSFAGAPGFDSALPQEDAGAATDSKESGASLAEPGQDVSGEQDDVPPSSSADHLEAASVETLFGEQGSLDGPLASVEMASDPADGSAPAESAEEAAPSWELDATDALAEPSALDVGMEPEGSSLEPEPGSEPIAAPENTAFEAAAGAVEQQAAAEGLLEVSRDLPSDEFVSGIDIEESASPELGAVQVAEPEQSEAVAAEADAFEISEPSVELAQEPGDEDGADLAMAQPGSMEEEGLAAGFDFVSDFDATTPEAGREAPSASETVEPLPEGAADEPALTPEVGWAGLQDIGAADSDGSAEAQPVLEPTANGEEASVPAADAAQSTAFGSDQAIAGEDLDLALTEESGGFDVGPPALEPLEVGLELSDGSEPSAALEGEPFSADAVRSAGDEEDPIAPGFLMEAPEPEASAVSLPEATPASTAEILESGAVAAEPDLEAADSVEEAWSVDVSEVEVEPAQPVEESVESSTAELDEPPGESTLDLTEAASAFEGAESEETAGFETDEGSLPDYAAPSAPEPESPAQALEQELEQELDFSSLLDEQDAPAEPAPQVSAEEQASGIEEQQEPAANPEAWTADAAVEALGGAEPPAAWQAAPDTSSAQVLAAPGRDEMEDEIAIPLADGSVFEPVDDPQPRAVYEAPPPAAMAPANTQDAAALELLASLRRVSEGLPPSDGMPIPVERLSRAVVKLLLDMGAINSDDLLEMLAIPPEKLSATIVKLLLARGLIGAEDIVSMLAISVDRLNASVLVMLLERGVFDAQRVLKALR